MKKIFALILVLTIFVSMLVSCDILDIINGNTESTSTTPTNTTTTTKTTTSTTTTTTKTEGSTSTTTTTATDKNDGTTSTTTTTENGGGNTNPPIDEPDPDNPIIEGKVEVILTGYSFETIFCEWAPYTNADSYNVYCDGVIVDKELIRSYGTYFRCDVLGLTEKFHEIEIVPTINGAEMLDAATTFSTKPISHVREGFAWVNGTASGAYNEDGTLRDGAVVLYVTNENKDTITLKMQTGKSTYEDKVGIQNIIDGIKKGYETRPLCIRFIGNITDPAFLWSGDILVDMNETKYTAGMTIEGVGNDATINGFGIRVKNCSNLEIRNLGFMNCDSDEGDNLGLQQNNHHVWVHNCDFFYGQAGSDADQSKGDGALDVKTSAYITLSFNHFVDSGKSNLLGMKNETAENYITYHHNWYDHSDSRHPRVRTCTTHVYNNYYDGVSKYGIGATMGASVFVENNYFRNTKYPMLSSLQGNDVAGGNEGTFSGENGGIIKAFGNYIDGGKGILTYQQNSTSFDCYLASSRDEKVPSSVVTLVGGTTYNNFDTNASLMYEYNAESAEDAKETVMQYAGRVQGGDFKWTFTAADDTSYDIIPGLKSALLAYTGTLVSTNVSTGVSGGNGGESGGESGGDSGSTTPEPAPVPEGTIIHNFDTDGKTSDFFTINGNLSSSKGTVTYNGLTLTQCLKLESSTSITFTLTEAKTMTLVFKPSASIKIDGTSYTSTTNVITVDLEAGTHTLTKDGSTNLYYIVLEDVK
ncbi:MAG: pectate lyase [Eubacteriales bacterium]